jgi:hypothetical protein
MMPALVSKKARAALDLQATACASIIYPIGMDFPPVGKNWTLRSRSMTLNVWVARRRAISSGA